MDKASQSTIIAKYESLDYSDDSNYLSLFAEYRRAKDGKMTDLANELYAIIRKVQKEKSNNNPNRKRTVQIDKKMNELPRKTRLLQKMYMKSSYDPPRAFSMLNVFQYCLIVAKAIGVINVSDVSEWFNIDEMLARDILKYATILGLLDNKYEDEYGIKKLNDIDENKLLVFGNTKAENVSEMVDGIEIPVLVKMPIVEEKKKNDNPFIPFREKRNEKTARGENGHYKGAEERSYAHELSSGFVDSMREVGHGRKRKKEYTEKMAIDNSRSRYGLKDEKPILEYDLD